jgi:hypothetical protein
MVREFVVSARQLDFRHVARDALVLGNRAGLRAYLSNRGFRNGSVCGLSAGVTGQAFAIEVYGFWIEVMVRVVAGEAADARIVRIVTLAARQTVRLKADVKDTRVPLLHDLCPGAVTLTTEIGSLFRGLPDQFMQTRGRRLLMIAGQHSSKMQVDSLVAMGALHSRAQLVEGQLLSLNGIGGVAGKAA